VDYYKHKTCLRDKIIFTGGFDRGPPSQRLWIHAILTDDKISQAWKIDYSINSLDNPMENGGKVLRHVKYSIPVRIHCQFYVYFYTLGVVCFIGGPE